MLNLQGKCFSKFDKCIKDIEASEFIGRKIIITNEAETERVILCAEEGL